MKSNLRIWRKKVNMGKAKEKLIVARNVFYEQMDNGKEMEVETEINDDKHILEQEENYIIDTTLLLRRRLLDYVDDEAWPLCEFLDFSNVENYIMWLLTHG